MIDPHLPATELAALLRDRQVSAVEVARAHLERLDAVNPALNAVVWVDRDDVLRRAAASDRRLADGTGGPFEGVPLPVKDLTAVAGQPCTLSSLAVEGTATTSHITVQLLEAAGFVLSGRTNSPEFGALTASENRRWGATRNPWDLSRSSGGSSGGAASAVAAGIATVAHASDGGGSIRVPAATTGLVGLKPSRGRVPSEVRGWEHSVTEGAITRTVADAAALLDVLGVPDPLGWYSAPPPPAPFADLAAGRAPAGDADGGRLRVGLLLDSPTGLPVAPECAEAAVVLARALEHLGHHVEPVAPFLMSLQSRVDFADVVVSASVWATPFDRERTDLLDPYIRYRVERARERHAGEYVAVSHRLQAESRRVVAQWGRDFDVLLTPTTAVPTPPVGEVYDEANAHPDRPGAVDAGLVTFTGFANTTGLPAVSLPVHHGPDGMPLGAQLVGAPWGEGQLLRLAQLVEPAFAWDRRRPPQP